MKLQQALRAGDCLCARVPGPLLFVRRGKVTEKLKGFHPNSNSNRERIAPKALSRLGILARSDWASETLL